MTARCQGEALLKRMLCGVPPGKATSRRSGVAGVTGEAGKGISFW